MSPKYDDEDDDEAVFEIKAGKKGAPRGRPNAYWAEHVQDNFSGSFRGVKPAPHGGQQTVSPDDTSGSYDLCWCGLPFDHDWPGKADGRTHPREDSNMTRIDEPTEGRIERRALRAYHADLVDVIMKAVNEYQVKYRITSRSVILYPPDGTSPYTVHARNGDRQRKSAQQWFVRHVLGPEGETQATRRARKEQPVDEAAIKELAEVVSSEEHLAKLDEEKPAPKPSAPQQPPPPPPTQAPPTPDEPEEPKKSKRRDLSNLPPPQVIDPNGEPGEWVPYMIPKGKLPQEPHPYFITNGVQVRCKTCDMLIERGPAGTGGHSRTHHTDTTTLWGPESRAKMSETARLNSMRKKVEAGIELLQQAIGEKPNAELAEANKLLAKQVAENAILQATIRKLEAKAGDTSEVEKLKTRIAELEQQISDMEAKAALAREALGL